MKKPVLEAPIVKKIKKKIEQRGWWGFKTHGSADQVRGLPDLIGCFNAECPNCGFGPIGRFVAFEVKKPGGDATPLQAFTIQRIKNAGGIAVVIHSVEEALDILDRIAPELPRESSEDRDD